MDSIVEVKNITKKYGKKKALDDVTLNIPKGSIYGLVGKNGAGKTTLMRLITGLQMPSEGEYKIFGVSYKDKNATKYRKQIGSLIEQPGIFSDLNAYQNMKVQFINLGMTSYSRINEILDMVGLGNVGKKPAMTFSLGMKQRLGIALAMAGNPDLLILDEPINGLDPEGIVDIREMLLRINKENGTTIIISSHILGELEHLATNYAFIDNGKIVKEISSAELKKECRKSSVLKVNGINELCIVLEKLGLEYKITGEDTIVVYGDFGLSELVMEASKAGADILDSETNNENLESYFLEIVGGNWYVFKS